MAEFCTTCARKMGFETEILEPGEICEGCGKASVVKSGDKWVILMFAIIALLVLLSNANAQCRRWVGEPIDSIPAIVKQMSSLTGVTMNKRTESTWIDSTDKYSFFHQDSADNYISAFVLKSPNAEKVWDWLKASVGGCITEQSDTYLVFGKSVFYYRKPGPFRDYGEVGLKTIVR